MAHCKPLLRRVRWSPEAMSAPDDVLNTILLMAGRHEIPIAQKMADIEQRLIELACLVRQLDRPDG
jgi:hypothetical protein